MGVSLIPNELKCSYCEREMDPHKMYMTTLDNKPMFESSVLAHGHKGCLTALKNAYNKFGRVMTEKEVQIERFDPSI